MPKSEVKDIRLWKYNDKWHAYSPELLQPDPALGYSHYVVVEGGTPQEALSILLRADD